MTAGLLKHQTKNHLLGALLDLEQIKEISREIAPELTSDIEMATQKIVKALDEIQRIIDADMCRQMMGDVDI